MEDVNGILDLYSFLKSLCLVFYIVYTIFAFPDCFEIACSWGYFSFSRVLIQVSQLFNLSKMTCVLHNAFQSLMIMIKPGSQLRD